MKASFIFSIKAILRSWGFQNAAIKNLWMDPNLLGPIMLPQYPPPLAPRHKHRVSPDSHEEDQGLVARGWWSKVGHSEEEQERYH